MRDPLPQDGTIRKLWIGERRLYREHLLRLDAQSRRNRFAGQLADEVISRHADQAFARGAVIHGFFAQGILRGAAELHAIGSPFAGEAEAALSIEKAWQSHGVGSALLRRTLLAARNRGVTFLHMSCLAENTRMQQLARKFAAELTFDFGGVVGEVAAPHPTPLSLMREALADGHGVAKALLEAQSRLLRSG
jgi:GNAT superfamily N-acetyltransferase